MKLPLLDSYRDKFTQDGLKLPLPRMPYKRTGILDELPFPPKEKLGWPWTEETSPSIYDTNVNWPKITIVTPSYNQVAFLEQTIRSILLQNYPNLEFIVMDGGSNDDSKLILERYNRWISYWRCENDGGQSNAINLGFSLANGDYYAWINSDDYYLKNTFFKVINRFNSTGAEFVYGYAFAFKTKEEKFELLKFPPLLDYFIRIPTLIQPSCFWQASIHQPLCEDLHCSLDYELWLRMIKGKSRSFIKEPLSVANIHDDAKTSDPKMKKAWEEDHALICSDEGHGPVYNWNTLKFLHSIHIKLFRFIEKISSSD